nr:hypothetical protein [Enterobacter hormaechei]
MFCRRHIGIPLERSPGVWVHSVATPHAAAGQHRGQEIM